MGDGRLLVVDGLNDLSHAKARSRKERLKKGKINRRFTRARRDDLSRRSLLFSEDGSLGEGGRTQTLKKKMFLFNRLIKRRFAEKPQPFERDARFYPFGAISNLSVFVWVNLWLIDRG